MMCYRDNLETQRQHVRRKSRLDDFGGIDALLAEMREALVKEAADGAENLQVVGDGCVVERKGHGVTLPQFCVLLACDTVAGICADCNRQRITPRHRQGIKATVPSALGHGRRAYSISSSAVASSDCGMLRPSVFAVLRLTINSYLVGACTGMSAGFSPLRMRSRYPAARLTGSSVLGPYVIRPPSMA